MSEQLQKPFWETKSMRDMTPTEWEQLCDGCAICCLHKLEDEDTGEICYTRVACRLLDLNTCQCQDYPNRSKKVPGCVMLSPDCLPAWIPDTCAYRLLASEQPLPWWHPLVSGDRQTVRQAGISIGEKAISEQYINRNELQHYLWEE
ncbi:MAG: YcgN family cysteine cluster protein [SAR324 cluster bacterium]|nr:YcgN family cysteine cluster protein [SAR324 cluster bacterium]